MDKNKPNLTVLNKGLHLDNSYVDSPKGTYRFALNTVSETELGDSTFKSNEESNELYVNLTPGYIPIGKCYIGNNEVVIFSVSAENNVSEIGILDDNATYKVVVNDANSLEKDKLNFRVESQIQATYRLRKGCEKTIYFAGKGYPVRYFNFNKVGQFKTNGLWTASKFSLYKSVGVFPTVDKVEVIDSAGNLLPGSYSVLVQHLDEDFNGTEFHELVKNINIVNDPLTKTYADIEGSSNIGDPNTAYKYSNTNKAISISLDSVDTDFTYVRFAFVERNTGTGQVSGVKYSDVISTRSPMFIYTGDNAESNGTIEEVEMFNMNAGIQSAEHIEQIDNMLILANIQGGEENLCKLQKYASKIKTDCFVKDIVLTSIREEHNAKNPIVDYNGIGYQPEDIYSLGIIYIFDDSTRSPVIHIPGKSPNVPKELIYAPAPGVFPMSNENNENSSERYLDENSSCPNSDYWGVDSEGVKLRNQKVRHHRFPSRSDINVGFVKRKQTTSNIAKFKQIQLSMLQIPKKSGDGYTAVNYSLKVKFNAGSSEQSFIENIHPDTNSTFGTMLSNIYQESQPISNIRLYYIESGSNVEVEIPLVNGESAVQDNEAKYKIGVGEVTENNTTHIYEVPIFGLKFSNIEIPSEEEIGKKIVGYQIVRQERTENDKNILDSAVVFPMLKAGRNVSTGLLAPEYFTNSTLAQRSSCEGSEDPTFPTCYNVSKRNIMLVTPGHKFMDKSHDGFTSIQQVGTFKTEYIARSANSIQNIYEGTSATGDEDKYTDDSDGFSLRHGYRFTGVVYGSTEGTPLNVSNEDTRMYNINAVNYAESEDAQETLYNLSCDNKALILSSNKQGADLRTYGPNKHHFPYVYVKKNTSTFYQNYKNRPYYFASTEIFTGDTCEVFGGDTHVVPMRYSNHVFANAVGAIRRKKMSVWVWIGVALITALSIVLSVFSGGTSLIIGGAILMGLGALATFHAARVEVDKFNEIYADKWQNNLDKTVFDYIYARLFIREHPNNGLDSYEPDPLYQAWEDDTFRWWGEIVGDLWFETPLNVSLRVPPLSHENNYLLPLKPYMNDNTGALMAISITHYIPNSSIGSGRFHRYPDAGDPAYLPSQPEENYFIRKITKPNGDKPSGYEYLGVSIPQIYLINPDHSVHVGIKRFYGLPIEYDCCSDCREKFPHRIHYSQQSFQEEKSDNYRIFLPNNYKDIEGETGEITNIFRFYNNLYAHTEEALWQMGRNYQERVTDNVVSFIGTGSYFEVPPQKILDDNTGASAGTKHKWSSIKTPAGIFFISENERKVYHFVGKNIQPISSAGLEKWFSKNLEIQFDRQYLEQTGKEYPYKDNPSNPLGTGFIVTYDSDKERIIFTKKDFKFKGEIFTGDKELLIEGNRVTLFEDFSQTIQDNTEGGWLLSDLKNSNLEFTREIYEEDTKQVGVQVWHPEVTEEVIDDSVVWVENLVLEGICSLEEGCNDLITYTDSEGEPHEKLYTHEYGSWNEVLEVQSFVDPEVEVILHTESDAVTNSLEINETIKKKEIVVVEYGHWETSFEEIPNNKIIKDIKFVGGIDKPKDELVDTNSSWTISYSIKDKVWISWHSYLPNFYINVPEKFYSWINGNNGIWKHNKLGSYQTFYGVYNPHIIEYVSLSNPIVSRIWDSFILQTEAKTYDTTTEYYVDERYVTFNKMILYNSRQCSGLLNLLVKGQEINDDEYLFNQINNIDKNSSIISRVDRDWFINDFRDLRVDYTKPIWDASIESLKSTYYIDKVLNEETIDYDKDWTQLESFKDKYLVIRLIFDKFANKKLITNFTLENEDPTLH